MHLLRKKEFDKISVIDICRESMVTRATFYAHYSDKYELLEDSISNVLLEPLEEYRSREHKITSFEEMFLVCEEVIHKIDEQRNVLGDILCKNDSVGFYIRKYLSSVLVNIISGQAIPSVPKEICSEYYSNACVGVVSLWIKNNLPYTAEDIIEFLKRLFRGE